MKNKKSTLQDLLEQHNCRSYSFGALPQFVEEDISAILLSKSENNKMIIDLEKIRQYRRIYPTTNVAYNLALAVIEHNKQIRFFESAISSQTHEILKLKAKIKKIESVMGVKNE